MFPGFTGRTSGTGRRARASKYLGYVDQFREWACNRNPADVTADEIEFEYIVVWEQRFLAMHGRCPSPRTTRNRLAALRSFYSFLENREWLRDSDGRAAINPMRRIESPKIPRRPNDWLSPEEDAALLAGATSAQERFVIMFLRWTGLRVDEARHVTISDVKMLDGKESIRVTRSKTNAGLRTIPIAPELLPELRLRISELQHRGEFSSAMPVFAGRSGEAISPQYVWRLVKETATRARIRCTGAPGESKSAVSPHTLRRTFGSDLINRGASLHAVQKALGHESPVITEQCYAELLSVTVRGELERAWTA